MSAINLERKGWHSRGYLPHFDADRFQFVTFHLADSFPKPLLDKFRLEQEHNKLEEYYDDQFRNRIEEYLDKGVGECILGFKNVAMMVEKAIKFYDGDRYDLRAWVIMPNHGHLLFRPLEGFSLSAIMKDLKGFTSRKTNKMLGRTGSIWHPDYFDTYIRNQDHFDSVISYIENNPVAAGLCARPADWPFSSARLSADKKNYI